MFFSIGKFNKKKAVEEKKVVEEDALPDIVSDDSDTDDDMPPLIPIEQEQAKEAKDEKEDEEDEKEEQVKIDEISVETRDTPLDSKPQNKCFAVSRFLCGFNK